MSHASDPSHPTIDTSSVQDTQHLPEHGTGGAAWTTWVPAAQPEPDVEHALVPSTPAAAPTAPPAPAPAPTAAVPYQQRPKPEVTYLPPPAGPNWGLVVVGLIFGLVGAGVVANQVAGFQVASVSELGPGVLVTAGLACALLGLVGIVTRRRRG